MAKKVLQAQSAPAPAQGLAPASAATLDEPAAATSALPKLPANGRFLLRCRPDRWAVHVSGLLVPLWGRLFVEPGLNNVENAASWRDAIGPSIQEGWSVVDNLGAGSPPGGSYLVSVDVPDGKHYMTCFDRAFAGSERIEHDHQGAHDWAWRLVSAGIIQPPAPHALRAQLAELEMRLLSQETRGRSDARQAAAAVITARQIATIKTYLDRIEQSATPVARSATTMEEG